MTKQVDSILQTAIETANGCQYCITCKHSYFNTVGIGEGLCKYQAEGSVFCMHPKKIQEFHSCDSWTPKDLEEKE